MRIAPRLFVVVTYLALISLKLTVSAVAVVDEETFQSCIERRQSRVSYEITKNDENLCRLSARRAQRRHVQLSDSNRTSPISASDESRDADRLSFEYFKALGMWKNGNADTATALLDKVAPCRKHSKSVTKKWSSMYDARRHREVILLKALDQRWQHGEGIVTFPPLDRSMNLERLQAGELLLQRQISAEIKNFGKYSTTVYLIKDNRTLERVHADWRTSCLSDISDAMVLDLDTEFIQNKWREEPSEPLQLRIRVKTRKQYLLKQLDRNFGTPVIRQVVGLVLHFSAAEEGLSTHLLSAFGIDENEPAGSEPSGDLLNVVERHASRRQRRDARRTAVRYVNTRPPPTPATRGRLSTRMRYVNTRPLPTPATRGRLATRMRYVNTRPPPRPATRGRLATRMRYVNTRSPTPATRGRLATRMRYVNTGAPPAPATRGWLATGRHCRRASYRLDRDVYDRMNIIDPEYEDFLFDIGKCTGDCPNPLTSALNATNHAIAISVGASRDDRLSICCVPVSYKSLTYTYRDDNLSLQQKRLRNFRAVSCACR